jgi:pseudouridine kinase
MSAGGVGRNIAENLARLGTRTHLIASIGADERGDQVLAATAAAGVLVDQVRRSACSTGTYTAVLDADGELVVAVADMAATGDLTPDRVREARDLIASASLVVLDGNLSTPTLACALDLVADADVRAVLEPVSVPKATALAGLLRSDRALFAVTPNRDELGALTGLPTGTDAELEHAVRALCDRGVDLVWVRLGSAGSLLSSRYDLVELAAVPAEVVDVTGAGDAMLAAFCHALLAGSDPADAARLGHAAAALTVADPHTVRPDLTDRLVRSHAR